MACNVKSDQARSAGTAPAPPPCIAKVAVELPLAGPLDYRIPSALRRYCAVGQRVMVPVGRREFLGYIVDLTDRSTVSELKSLSEILDDAPLLSPDLLWLTRWVSDYYLCPWGQVLKAAVPEGFRGRSVTVYDLTPEARRAPETWPAGRAGEVLRSLEQQGSLRQREIARAVGTGQLADLLRRIEGSRSCLSEPQASGP